MNWKDEKIKAIVKPNNPTARAIPNKSNNTDLLITSYPFCFL